MSPITGITNRWLKFCISRDPQLKLDKLDLLTGFARKEHLSVAELFREFQADERRSGKQFKPPAPEGTRPE